MMYVVCVESSNSRGMGHLFRALLYIDYFKKNSLEYLLLINDDKYSLQILKEKSIGYLLVDFNDITSNWEKQIITNYKVDVWINDKFETSFEMGKHISGTGILFCLIDDIGEGENFADINFAGMIYPTKKNIKGKNTFCGNEYMILNPEIAKYKKERHSLNSIVVSMGGSDPHGVTLEVVKELKNYDYHFDIVIGPNFIYKEALNKLIGCQHKVYQNVPSLIEMFTHYDLAITGGGVTCCEANAAGLPCIIIANAQHEINTGKYMESLGGAILAGSYGEWNHKVLEQLDKININKMSLSGMQNLYLDTVQRIMHIIQQIQKESV